MLAVSCSLIVVWLCVVRWSLVVVRRSLRVVCSRLLGVVYCLLFCWSCVVRCMVVVVCCCLLLFVVVCCVLADCLLFVGCWLWLFAAV